MALFRSVLYVSIIASTFAAPTDWGFYRQDGKTKLFGTAFGLIGKDETYDYVVCVRAITGDWFPWSELIVRSSGVECQA